MIVDSLRYWVAEMHVDGFRFDLASILSRDSRGSPLPNPPVLWDIESDPALAGTKLIAEAWDAAGLYQVGSFVGDSLEGMERPIPRRRPQLLPRRTRLVPVASPTDSSAARRSTATSEREAEQSVNFVTCHDGFTLNDLVSYNDKHNDANGEDNRDGANDNLSWNCGVEGPTDDPDVEQLRNRQVKNLSAATLLVARHADDSDGRRSAPHPARQQQRLLPGRRNTGSTGPCSRSTPTSTASSAFSPQAISA